MSRTTRFLMLSSLPVALAFAFPLGQYLGRLSADTGWNLLRPRGV